MDDGYIKYNCNWTKCEIEVSEMILTELNEVRSILIGMGMIGKIIDGPGFGNISMRKYRHEFLITGTNTGHLAQLKPENISLVTQADIKNNTVCCSGLSQASSESLSHASIYETFDWVNAVLHVHHKAMWQHYSNKLPTTNTKIGYGTVEMANEIKEKLTANTHSKVLVLGGHEDGLIAFGNTLAEAFKEIENLFQTIN